MTSPFDHSLARLAAALRALDGRSYPAYRNIAGSHGTPALTLFIDHVQPDPFAPPTRCRAVIPQSHARFRAEWLATPQRRTAAPRWLT